MTDYETELLTLRNRVEELEHENQLMREAIACATEQLGHSGCSPVDLEDAVGQIDRLLAGRDLEVALEGMADEVQALVCLCCGTFDLSKREVLLAAMPRVKVLRCVK